MRVFSKKSLDFGSSQCLPKNVQDARNLRQTVRRSSSCISVILASNSSLGNGDFFWRRMDDCCPEMFESLKVRWWLIMSLRQCHKRTIPKQVITIFIGGMWLPFPGKWVVYDIVLTTWIANGCQCSRMVNGGKTMNIYQPRRMGLWLLPRDPYKKGHSDKLMLSVLSRLERCYLSN